MKQVKCWTPWNQWKNKAFYVLLAIFLWKTLILQKDLENVNKKSLCKLYTQLKGFTYSKLCISKTTKKTSDSCRGRPSGKVCILFRSLNIPDIIKCATYLQVNSATYKYLPTHPRDHLSVNLRRFTSLYVASKCSVKVDYQQTCSLLVKVMGLTCMSTGTWTFFIFVPGAFVLIFFVFPFFQQSVHMKAVKVRICSQKFVPRLYFLDSFSVSTDK